MGGGSETWRDCHWPAGGAAVSGLGEIAELLNRTAADERH
jgi:hypothetical protein